IADGSRSVTLAQLLSVQPMDHRKVREARKILAERAVEHDLLGRVGDVIVAVLVREGDALVHEIIPFRDTVLVRNAKAHDVRVAALESLFLFVQWNLGPLALVLVYLAARLRRRASLLEHTLRREVAICETGIEQLLDIRAMPLEVRALIYDGLVPVEAKPLESVENCARALVGT